MKNILGITLLVFLTMFVVAGFRTSRVVSDITTPHSATYESEKYGISFSYPSTYFITENLAPGSALREHMTILLVEDTEFNRKLIAGEIQGTEGPVSVAIDIYQNNLDKQSLHDWVTGTNDSNFKLSDGSSAPTVIAGEEAVKYSWDGLYRGDTTAFVHGDYIFAATVTYLTPEDQIRKDYEDIVKTITFE